MRAKSLSNSRLNPLALARRKGHDTSDERDERDDNDENVNTWLLNTFPIPGWTPLQEGRVNDESDDKDENVENRQLKTSPIPGWTHLQGGRVNGGRGLEFVHKEKLSRRRRGETKSCLYLFVYNFFV